MGLFGGCRTRSSLLRPAASRKVAERRQKAEAELAAARTEERKAQREHAGAAKAAERAQKRAKDAEERAGEARKRAEEAQSGLREAKRRESDAAKAYDRAARAVAAAEKKLAYARSLYPFENNRRFTANRAAVASVRRNSDSATLASA